MRDLCSQRRGLVAVSVIGLIAVACRASPPPAGTRWLPGNEAHWRGWIELVPAIRTPRFHDHRDETRVFARFAPGTRITLADPRDRRSLRVPVGAALDRVERFRLVAGYRVVDVRGTVFSERGEVFHVERPIDARGGGLFGVSWPRAELPPPSIVGAMTDAMREGNGLAGVPARGRARAIERFRGLLRCAGCHRARQPMRGGAPDAWPRRETDASGLYSLLATLRDRDVVETYRPRDPNRDAPFVTETSAAQGFLVAAIDVLHGLRGRDPHVRALCASRAALLPWLGDDVRRAFSAELRRCGLAVDSR